MVTAWRYDHQNSSPGKLIGANMRFGLYAGVSWIPFSWEAVTVAVRTTLTIVRHPQPLLLELSYARALSGPTFTPALSTSPRAMRVYSS